MRTDLAASLHEMLGGGETDTKLTRVDIHTLGLRLHAISRPPPPPAPFQKHFPLGVRAVELRGNFFRVNPLRARFPGVFAPRRSRGLKLLSKPPPNFKTPPS